MWQWPNYTNISCSDKMVPFHTISTSLLHPQARPCPTPANIGCKRNPSPGGFTNPVTSAGMVFLKKNGPVVKISQLKSKECDPLPTHLEGVSRCFKRVCIVWGPQRKRMEPEVWFVSKKRGVITGKRGETWYNISFFHKLIHTQIYSNHVIMTTSNQP